MAQVVWLAFAASAATVHAQAPILTTVAPSRAIADRPSERPPSQTPPETQSRSVGVPDRGRLREGVRITEGPGLFIRENRRQAAFGTAELVRLIHHAGAELADRTPGANVVVGDLSREGGRRATPHRSHQSGRDADIGILVRDEEGNSHQLERFVDLRRNGCGRLAGERLCFDPARNWALISAMVSESTVPVQYILIAPDIRRRLLNEGERQEADEALLERVRTVTAPHGGSASHRSHYHVRIYCPLDDRPQCVDEPPYHDWYVGEPSAVPASVRRRRGRQRARRRRQAERQRARARRRRARARRRRRARRARRARRRGRGVAAQSAEP